METVVGVAENDGGMIEEDSVLQTTSASLSSSKPIGNPVVYKLVRVEGDGRLVPATDDEIMEVKDLLEKNNSEMRIVTDAGQNVECISDEGLSAGAPQSESSEGLSQSDNVEPDAGQLNSRLECIEEMLQKVKQEERLRLTHGSSNYPPYMNANVLYCDQNDKLANGQGKLESETQLQESIPSSIRTSNDCHTDQSSEVGGCANPLDGLKEAASPTSTICSIAAPDFSKIKGEICLDNQTIRELQETFRATFGRETTVKDKRWLKRRIAMGLTNSYDIPNTSFIIKDHKLVKCKEVNTKNEAKADHCENSPTSFKQSASDKSPIDNFRGHDHGGGDLDIENRAAKRVRKPTKRYIEELSEAESKHQSGKSMTSPSDSMLGQWTPKSQARSVRSVTSGGRIVVTRMVSLAGSSIQVPYVSHTRRSRPRENVMALVDFHPSCTDIKSASAKNSLCLNPSQLNTEDGQEKSASEQIQQESVTEPRNDEHHSAVEPVEVVCNIGLKHVDTCENSPDDNMVRVPTATGGIRRKHHRAWTLSEVMRLVEGVSKHGAGKWSEIKRLSFASYSYRTSVDLKDKWRNLLKASFAQTPSEKGSNFRKHGSTPIPTPILLKVRELAEKQGQVPPTPSSSKPAGDSGRSVNERRSGFL